MRRLVCALFCLASFVLCTSCNPPANPRERCTGRIFKQTVRELSKDGLRGSAIGVGSNPGAQWINYLRVNVDVDGPLDEDRARAIVIRVARELYHQINTSQCSKELFERIPTSTESVNVGVISTEYREEYCFAPYIQASGFYGDKIIYMGQLGPDSQGFDYEYEETLEEALQKLGEAHF